MVDLQKLSHRFATANASIAAISREHFIPNAHTEKALPVYAATAQSLRNKIDATAART